jgi:hypothetical protein
LIDSNRYELVNQHAEGMRQSFHERSNGLHQTRVVISFEQLLVPGQTVVLVSFGEASLGFHSLEKRMDSGTDSTDVKLTLS